MLCVLVQVCLSEVEVGSFLQSLSTSVRQGLFLNLNSLIVLVWLSSKLQGSLVSASRTWVLGILSSGSQAFYQLRYLLTLRLSVFKYRFYFSLLANQIRDRVSLAALAVLAFTLLKLVSNSEIRLSLGLK